MIYPIAIISIETVGKAPLWMKKKCCKKYKKGKACKKCPRNKMKHPLSATPTIVFA